jgi:hypothetical protein
MPKQIRGLSWFKPSELPSIPNNEFLGELDWINANISSGFSEHQVERLRDYRGVLEADYQRRKANRWL